MSPPRSYHVLDNFLFLLFFHLGRICDIESIHPFHLSEPVACGDTLQVGDSTSGSAFRYCTSCRVGGRWDTIWSEPTLSGMAGLKYLTPSLLISLGVPGSGKNISFQKLSLTVITIDFAGLVRGVRG